MDGGMKTYTKELFVQDDMTRRASYYLVFMKGSNYMKLKRDNDTLCSVLLPELVNFR